MHARNASIPERLNLIIAATIYVAVIFLLWLGSQLDWAGTFAVGIIFSFILLCNYALMHEATHDMLHSRRGTNWLLGMMLGWLFPMSFTVLHVTHIVHHCCNRTDHEMFDCYYEGDSMFLKYTQWYGLLLGFWWILIPIGCLLLLVAPSSVRSLPFRRSRSTAVLFDDFGAREMLKIRVEILLGIGFWGVLFWTLQLDWRSVLLMYACFGFNWSTRQYVTHAFTERDVTNGALNLKVSRPMQWLLLNGHWDLVHHQHPHLPWTHLPEKGPDSAPPISYWRQYWRLWRGPKKTEAPGPNMLAKNVYQEMS
jgi:fatty acid desaturase